nr:MULTISPECIES: type II toxin-antitoxin system PemK/MazF family toxin [Halostella]
MTDEDPPIFERGDVVYGDDPFKGDEDARPWLILSNHEGRPFHGEQYIALTLTSKSWMDGLIDIPEESWLRGGTPDESRVIPWVYNRSVTRISISGRAVWRMISSIP